ncbi:hypothetical protein [Alcanivorax sp. DP30]|uniref:hypothetical protein n=1 Tax=Alcanivorax sp. DP30 TaxID=2606217 RepID=UPI001369533F|nr:hypothetical protein [Alcanivorax sp. DP30]MZR62960.1 hypothetical protein [Alcanivorax sp. DP30]
MSVLSQLLMQLPAFLIALAGFVLAGIFMGKARTPAILVIIASILTLLQSGFSVFNQLVLLEWMINGEISNDTYSIIASAGFTIFYMAISALLLAAVFTGRDNPTTAHGDATSPDTATGDQAALAPHRGGLILTLGLLGLLMFAPLGIAAWIMASSDLNTIREGRMDKRGEGMTLAGKILGILATVLMVVGIVTFLGVMAILASSYRGF